ncbi:MAG: DUF5110 domain-containing protein [Kosmotogaceae bacterium]|nr:DUF5110 domain-containing protein [Kosmotogaceae bacterium]
MKKRFFRYLNSVVKIDVVREGKTKLKSGAVIAEPEEELDEPNACQLLGGLAIGQATPPVSCTGNRMSIAENETGYVVTISLQKNQAVLGLGETMGPLNKRGSILEMYNTDEPDHSPSKRRLYSSLPILHIVSPEEQFALFLDHPGYSSFDIGFENRDTLKISIEGDGFGLFIIVGSPSDTVRGIFKLTGNPLLFPAWSLGYHQSRWSYANEETVMEIAENFRRRHIPCDAIHLDIDYMEDFKVFTWDKNRFPNPSSLTDRLSEMGIKTVVIVDPGVKAQNGFDIYEEGQKKDFFCLRADGRPFRAAVWPGESRLPDFLNSTVRKWWGQFYDRLMKNGVSGFWNDMNEPAIFYTPESLLELKLMAGELHDSGIETEFLFGRIFSKKKYYDHGVDFVQKEDDGNTRFHREVRNIYGFNMARAAYEGIKKSNPDLRPFNITRSSYPGIQRYAVLWTGDNASQWEQLLNEIRLVQSISLAGVSFTGCDVGGFGDDCSGELLVRWTQFGAFLPFFRNHSAIGTRNQEPWAFDEEVEELVRRAIELRYSLLPYLYTVHKQSADGEMTMIRPLALVWPGDSETYYADDQFMIGSSIMVAPVYQRNSEGRHVYLPGEEWLDLNTTEVVYSGHSWAKAPLETIPHYLKKDSLIAMTDGLQFVKNASWKVLKIKGFVKNRAEFHLYEDDGLTEAYKRGEYSLKKVVVHSTSDGMKVEVKPQEGSFKCAERMISFEIHDGTKLYERSIVDSPNGCEFLID